MDLFINKKTWAHFSETEMQQYQSELFHHYRTNGFPYFPTNEDWRAKELGKLMKYDYTKCVNTSDNIIKQVMHGLSLCWSYHPHHYDVVCNNMRTVKDTFDDDTLLRKVIAKRIKHGDNMSDNGLRKMIKVFSGTQCVSNFRPTAAAALYTHFCKKGGTVWDMSSGYGGRCLGAHLAGVHYIGTDPCTLNFNGVQSMAKDINASAELYNIGSEDYLPDENSLDMCFTSPPYFDCEKYSEEGTQSYIKYPSKSAWLNGFMAQTLRNCKMGLKSGGVLVINVQNVKSYPSLVEDVVNLANNLGFDEQQRWGIYLSRLGKGGYKTEPVLVFKINK